MYGESDLNSLLALYARFVVSLHKPTANIYRGIRVDLYDVLYPNTSYLMCQGPKKVAETVTLLSYLLETLAR